MKVLLFLRRLDYGGAERQAVALAKGLHQRGWQVAVAVFYAGGPLQPELEAEGIPVIALGKKGRWDLSGAVRGLRRVLSSIQPDVLYTYLDVPNVLSAIVLPRSSRTRLIWGIRNSGMLPSETNWFQQAVSWAERKLSSRPSLLIANSNAGRDHTLKWGVGPERVRVVFNGIDTQRFRPYSGIKTRQLLGFGDETPIIGIVGRIEPMKGHTTFLRAAAQLARVRQEVRFVCIGSGSLAYEHELRALARESGINDLIRWLGPQQQMELVYPALNLLCSCSYAEGFPNVVGEAMASGVPAIVTDAGESTSVVGDTGWVVPSGDAAALGQAMLRALELSREHRISLGQQARQRIEANFSIARMIDATTEALACH